MFYHLASIIWDPNPVCFTLPILNFPVLWYSLFFALGYFFTFTYFSKSIYKKYPRNEAKKFIDQLVLFLFFGMLIGARLGHVFFYEWSFYQHQPHKILFTWEGGLASHGAVIGILLALYLFWKKKKRPKLPDLCFWSLLDRLTLSSLCAAGFIRIGNFFNQEIVGTSYSGLFSITFLHPMESAYALTCHPVQLYEAFFYFTALYLFHRKKERFNQPGSLAGSILFTLFSFRFCIEYLKYSQEVLFGLNSGQLLSIPFIIFGLFLMKKKRSDKNSVTS